MIEIGSIREVQEQLESNGYHISQYTLRKWTKQGRIGAVYCGVKVLISYRNVMELLIRDTKTPEL